MSLDLPIFKGIEFSSSSSTSSSKAEISFRRTSFIFFLISESIAYEFGPGRGSMTYTFPSSSVADTETDKVALGFVTSKADAVLLRIESSNTQDYMQMEIVSVFKFGGLT